jgi:hypothetical protein
MAEGSEQEDEGGRRMERPRPSQPEPDPEPEDPRAQAEDVAADDAARPMPDHADHPGQAWGLRFPRRSAQADELEPRQRGGERPLDELGDDERQRAVDEQRLAAEERRQREREAEGPDQGQRRP